ncbi:MAG TPA: HEAT repeat domain-containing protein [Haliangium sp.]|nr:HEAT repeat domain-containing protein [Haliangium sp.]
MSTNTVTSSHSRHLKLLALLLPVVAMGAILASAAFSTRSAPDPGQPPVPSVQVEPAMPPPEAPALPAIDPSAARADAARQIDRHGDDVDPAVRGFWSRALGELTDASFRKAARERFVREPDAEVRALLAWTLGMLGSEDARAEILERLPGARPEQAVWYLEALCRLRHAPSCSRLAGLASHQALAVAFKASLAVADLSDAGDRRAIRLLEALARREVELRKFDSLAGLTILARLARLGHKRARTQLYALLEHEDELLRLSAARSLGWIGDETGKDVLTAILNDGQSQRRLDAAVGLAQLGDYSGAALLRDHLDHRDADQRRVAARWLGTIGDLDSARPLMALYADPDRTVRIAAAAGVLFLLGLEPALLVQESVSWVLTSLRSEDWQVRQVAAAPLRYLPPDQGIPLLTTGIADTDARVRRRFAEEAVHLGAGAAPVIAEALRFETDPAVQEQEIIALAKIANPEVKDTLEEMAKREGRVGILSLGGLISVGEVSASERLARAYQRAIDGIRMAVVDAAILAGNRIVVPTLEQAIEDRVAEIRLAAARGLAHYGVTSARVIAILEQALGKAPEQAMGAVEALMQLGIKPKAGPSASEMLDSSSESVRRAVMRTVTALPWNEARPVITRAIRHSDPEVRRQAVDALAGYAEAHRNDVVPMLKTVAQDEDEVSRVKSRTQLAQLLPRQAPPAPSAPASTDTGGAPAPTWSLDHIRGALDHARTQRKVFDAQQQLINGMLEELTVLVAQRARHEKDVEDVERMSTGLREAQPRLLAAHGLLGAAVNAVTSAARELPDTLTEIAAMQAEATRLGEETMAAVADSRRRVEAILATSEIWVEENTADCELYLSAAEAAVATTRLGDARRDLLKADQTCGRRGQAPAQLHFVWAQYHDGRAQETQNPRQRQRFFAQAKKQYDAFAATGRGFRAEKARERSQEIAAELAGGAAQGN